MGRVREVGRLEQAGPVREARRFEQVGCLGEGRTRSGQQRRRARIAVHRARGALTEANRGLPTWAVQVPVATWRVAPIGRSASPLKRRLKATIPTSRATPWKGVKNFSAHCAWVMSDSTKPARAMFSIQKITCSAHGQTCGRSFAKSCMRPKAMLVITPRKIE